MNYRRESSTLSDRSTVSSIQGKGFITPDKLDRQVREGGGVPGAYAGFYPGGNLVTLSGEGEGMYSIPVRRLKTLFEPGT